jgi:hypothetical protein
MTNALYRLIRGVVRATRHWPGPRHVYTKLYQQAAAAAGRLAHSEQSIVGIYARNSYADGTWLPGVSDIDLTVVFRNASAHDLHRFRERYDRLRTVFPMLGETELLEERHVEAWTARGYVGDQARRWQRIGGAHQLHVCYRGDERLDRLRHATAIYRYNLLPLFSYSAKSDSTFQRFAAKLFRLFDKPAPPSEYDRSRLLAVCLRELSQQIAAVPLDNHGGAVDYAKLLGDCRSVERRASVPTSAYCTALLGRAEDIIPRYALVPTGTTELDRALSGTTVMDLPVFRFYLCHVDPLEYLGLLRARTTFHGPDVLATPFPLSRRMLRDSVQHYAVQMLTFPYRRELDEMTTGEFRNLFYGWFLRTLRFFEDGHMDFQYHVLRDYFGSRHLDGGGETRTALLLDVADDLAPHLLEPE